MQLRKNTNWGVYLQLHCGTLLCAALLHHGDGHLVCASSESVKDIVTCRLNERDLQSFHTPRLNVQPGQKVEIFSASPENKTETSTACLWKQSELLPLERVIIHETDGVYTVICYIGTNTYSVNISVHITSERRPSIPQLNVALVRKMVVSFTCHSEGNPKPHIVWYSDNKLLSQETLLRESIVGASDSNTSQIKCCGRNLYGEECSQIYRYDLERSMQQSEASQILLRTGQSLILQCQVKVDPIEGSSFAKWFFKGSEVRRISTLLYDVASEYYFKASVSVQDSGNYTCINNSGKTKVTHVQVYEKDFIDIQKIDENVQILVENRAHIFLEVQVLSLPKAQCYWITPNESKVQCTETQHLFGKSTFKLYNPEPGKYQVQLRAGEAVATRAICVTDVPKVTLLQGLDKVTCITNHTSHLIWKTRSSHADFKDWKEIYINSTESPGVLMASNQFCQSSIIHSRARKELNNNYVKCCVKAALYKDTPYCTEEQLVKIASEPSVVLMVVCSVLVVVLLLLSFILLHFIRKKKPGYESQLQMIQMVGPSDNDYIYIDFRDFKYDQKWEFPRENLELGKELGSGAFGMVVQATAYGISKPGVSMQVAVKMLKDTHHAVEKEALMSELKMLSYVGNHINIVNLLGACTGTGPIYLIFQYCCHGDLLNYLKNNREHFCKSLTDAFNKDRFSSLYINHQRKRNSGKPFLSGDNAYMDMSPVIKEQDPLLNLSNASMDFTQETFEGEDEEDLQTLTYDDLLCFSYQVAKGMEFLSSKNCIHRDLAARNILVSQGRLVKIGDFGLARDINNDSNYVVRGNARLPVKWMAPESIFKGIYTMQSDVWAYGILLWEIFSLGVTPYPGIKVDNTFYTMIERGFRMDRPYYASDSVYKMMCHCWSLEAKDRPCFSKLQAFMEYQLNYVEKQLYFNVGVQDNTDSVYQNAPVTSESGEAVKDIGQSAVMDSSDKTKTIKEYAEME